MNPVQIDAIVEPVLEELGRHLKWKSRGELAFDKDSTWIGSLLENHLAKVPDGARPTVVQRLHSFGHYLEREQRAYDASRTFFVGLDSATKGIPLTGSAPRTLPTDGSTSRTRLPADGSSTPPTKKWTFKTKRGASRKSALRPYKRITTRV